MLIDFSKLLCLTVLELWRRAWRAVEQHLPLTASVLGWPSRLAEARCARRMEGMVTQLLAMIGKIELVRSQLHAGLQIASIAEDQRFRQMLKVVKTDMRALQHEALAWQGDGDARAASARLRTALAQLTRVSEQLFLLADQVLGELARHDGATAAAGRR